MNAPVAIRPIGRVLRMRFFTDVSLSSKDVTYRLGVSVRGESHNTFSAAAANVGRAMSIVYPTRLACQGDGQGPLAQRCAYRIPGTSLTLPTLFEVHGFPRGHGISRLIRDAKRSLAARCERAYCLCIKELSHVCALGPTVASGLLQGRDDHSTCVSPETSHRLALARRILTDDCYPDQGTEQAVS